MPDFEFSGGGAESEEVSQEVATSTPSVPSLNIEQNIKPSDSDVFRETLSNQNTAGRYGDAMNMKQETEAQEPVLEDNMIKTGTKIDNLYSTRENRSRQIGEIEMKNEQLEEKAAFGMANRKEQKEIVSNDERIAELDAEIERITQLRRTQEIVRENLNFQLAQVTGLLDSMENTISTLKARYLRRMEDNIKETQKVEDMDKPLTERHWMGMTGSLANLDKISTEIREGNQE